MSDSPATPSVIWHGWMNTLLASVRAQVESAAVRHRAMAGASTMSALIWIRTANGGSESGVLTTMNEEVSPGVPELVDFLNKLPEPARSKIIAALASKQPQA